MNPLNVDNEDINSKINSYKKITSNGKASTEDIKINDLKSLMANNLFVSKDVNWYSKCNRYGWIDPYDNDRVTKEYLFFTKPDLYLFDGEASVSKINKNLKSNPIIHDAVARMPYCISQLQSSVKNNDGSNGSFMYILSNAVASKLDLPGISSDSQDSTKNVMGAAISYRGHSLKSDYGFDFSLSFKDTAYLEIYTLVKVYDEWERMVKLGITAPHRDYIVNHILSDQFSIYKFLIGSDGETILYYAKLTGCYFTDVPRSDFGDPGDEGFKYSLSFHAQFVEDMNPLLLSEFNRVVNHPTSGKTPLKVFDNKIGVNNEWGTYPKVVKIYRDNSKRVNRRNVAYDYMLKWYN